MVKCFFELVKDVAFVYASCFFGVRLRYRRIYALCNVCYMVSS